mmetsp:Transcript_66471/g.131787  ORF Transcript_66471/g.131787 Transcript_66471/m.131787 type:complete len:235 (-) Transcript_66471:103-807(-)
MCFDRVEGEQIARIDNRHAAVLRAGRNKRRHAVAACSSCAKAADWTRECCCGDRCVQLTHIEQTQRAAFRAGEQLSLSCAHHQADYGRGVRGEARGGGSCGSRVPQTHHTVTCTSCKGFGGKPDSRMDLNVTPGTGRKMLESASWSSRHGGLPQLGGAIQARRCQLWASNARCYGGHRAGVLTQCGQRLKRLFGLVPEGDVTAVITTDQHVSRSPCCVCSACCGGSLSNHAKTS